MRLTLFWRALVWLAGIIYLSDDGECLFGSYFRKCDEISVFLY